jgi:predicted house-cleaning NTP pyrophosphatase (Maf/HAM1 superfamily)
VRFRVVVSTFDESLDKAALGTPEAYVLATARHKTLNVIALMVRRGGPMCSHGRCG